MFIKITDTINKCVSLSLASNRSKSKKFLLPFCIVESSLNVEFRFEKKKNKRRSWINLTSTGTNFNYQNCLYIIVYIAISLRLDVSSSLKGFIVTSFICYIIALYKRNIILKMYGPLCFNYILLSISRGNKMKIEEDK